MFSVIIPYYNSKEFLRDCIESVTSQTYKDFEIIIIDDGSNDGSAEILDEYSKTYNNLHVYHFENAGVSYSRRRGILLSSGEYLVFVDSDDTINPNLLFELYVAINEHSFPDIIRYQANLIHDLPHKDHERYNFTENLNKSFSGIDMIRNWSRPGKKYAVYWLFAFRKNVFSKVLFGTNLRCYEDVALIPVLIAASQNLVTIDYIGYNYTCNNYNSLTKARSAEAERSRAIDFVSACKYAIENFCKLDTVSHIDIVFFIEDYIGRLHRKYEALPENLQVELKELFKL